MLTLEHLEILRRFHATSICILKPGSGRCFGTGPTKRHGDLPWPTIKSMERKYIRIRSILEELAVRPDAVLVSADYTKCKVFLSVMGILEATPKVAGPNQTILRSDAHATHFVIAIYWSGYPHPDQNGYQVICLPKCQTSNQKFAEFTEYLMSAVRGHDRLDLEWRL